MEMAQHVVPGDVVGAANAIAGPGVYTADDGRLIAEVVGECVTQRDGTVCVKPRKPMAPLVEVGATVVARVQRLTAQQVTCEILRVGDRPLVEPAPAILRREDVLATNGELADLAASFRAGMLMRARVVALGDARFYVSTADEEHGPMDGE